LIYFNGCSFTYGYELGSIFASRFSRLVSDTFGEKEWNNAKVGSSNARIWRTTMTDVILKKPKLVVIMWSGPNREEFFQYARGKWGWKNATWKNYTVDKDTLQANSKCNSSKSVDQSKVHYDSLNNYMKNVKNVPWNLRYTLQYMLSVKYFLEAMGVPYLFYTFSRTQYVNYLDILDWETWDCTSADSVSIELSKDQILKELPFIQEPGFYDYCKMHDLPIGLKDHPLEEAHEWMANKIVKDIKKNGLDKRFTG